MSTLTARLAVILDMDGLMLDTEPISLQAWKDAAHGVGFVLDDETCRLMIGRSQASNREMLGFRLGPDCPIDELVRSAQTRYREALDRGGVPLKPGLIEFIHLLDELEMPRAVATSTHTDLARYKLQLAGVLQNFAVVVGGEQVKSGKPSPDIFLEAAARLNYPARDCIVLEDSEPGIRAAVAAGMRPILIPDGRIPSLEETALAYAVSESLAEAGGLIEQTLRGRQG